MVKYQDYLLDLHGNAVAYASVLVRFTDGSSADIFSDAAGLTVRTNPTTTDSTGHFFFFGVQGHYDLIITLPDGGTQTVTEVYLPTDAAIIGGGGGGGGGSGLNFALLTPDTGLTSASASLSAAIATGLPIAVQKTTNGIYLLTSNVTIPSGSAIWGMGGVFRPALGVVLTINCPIFCPENEPLFDLSLGGTLGGTPQVQRFMANWIASVDRSFGTDSGPGINSALRLCTGLYAPGLGLLSGRYKINTPLVKPDSFFCPMIEGVAGGNAGAVGEQSCVLDASASGFGLGQPVLRIVGGSGHPCTGGLRNIVIRGTEANIGLQIAGLCGLLIDRCQFQANLSDVHLWNQRNRDAVEFITFRDCVWFKADQGGYCVVFENNTGAGGLHSFHGVAFHNCWLNLGWKSTGFWIGEGAQWYDGYLDIQVFYYSGRFADHDFNPATPNIFVWTTTPQYLFEWQNIGGSDYPVQVGGGSVSVEGGHGMARLNRVYSAIDKVVFYGGTVRGLNGHMFGDFFLVDHSCSYGEESIGNGLSFSRRRRYSDSNRSLTTGTNSVFGNPGISNLYDIIIESHRTNGFYYIRHTGMALWSDSGTSDGWWEEFERPDIFNSVAYNPVNLAEGDAVTASVTVTGAVLGMLATARASVSLQGCTLTAWVSAADTVTYRIQNFTNADVTIGITTVSITVTAEYTQAITPGTLAPATASLTSTTLAATGAVLGAPVAVDFSLDLQDITLTAYVQAAGLLEANFYNGTGVTRTLGAGTLTYTTDFAGTKAAFTPGLIADLADVVTTVTVTGAAVGDYTEASFSIDLTEITLTSWVSAADTVSVRFQNNTGAGVTLGAGNIKVAVTKKFTQAITPGTLAPATNSLTTATVAATGVTLGTPVLIDFSLDLQDITLTAYVQSAGLLEAVFNNGTGVTRTLGAGTLTYTTYLSANHSITPGILTDTAGAVTTVAVPGATLGRYTDCSYSLDLQGITMHSWVSADNVVSVRFQNNGPTSVNLAAGELFVRVKRDRRPGQSQVDQAGYGWALISVSTVNDLVLTNDRWPKRIQTSLTVGAGKDQSIFSVTTNTEAGADAEFDDIGNTLIVPSNVSKWTTGIPVIWTLDSGTVGTGDPAQIATGVRYFVIRISDTVIQLAASYTDAVDNAGTGAIPVVFGAKTAPVWHISQLMGLPGDRFLLTMNSTTVHSPTGDTWLTSVTDAQIGTLQTSASVPAQFNITPGTIMANVGNTVFTYAVYFRYNVMQFGESIVGQGKWAYMSGSEPA